MKVLINLSLLTVLVCSSLSLEAQNPIAELEVDMVMEEELTDSLAQEMYDLTYQLEITNAGIIDKIHCKLGSEEETSDLLYKIVNIDGSNASAINVNLSWEGTVLSIDFGIQHVPIEFYAEVVAVEADGKINTAVIH